MARRTSFFSRRVEQRPRNRRTNDGRRERRHEHQGQRVGFFVTIEEASSWQMFSNTCLTRRGVHDVLHSFLFFRALVPPVQEVSLVNQCIPTVLVEPLQSSSPSVPAADRNYNPSQIRGMPAALSQVSAIIMIRAITMGYRKADATARRDACTCVLLAWPACKTEQAWRNRTVAGL